MLTYPSSNSQCQVFFLSFFSSIGLNATTYHNPSIFLSHVDFFVKRELNLPPFDLPYFLSNKTILFPS